MSMSAHLQIFMKAELPSNIYMLRNSLKVIRVAAYLVTAEMIDLLTILYFSVPSNKGHPVR
jgi:hypothetical protein